MTITVACVKQGAKYPPEYVLVLRDMVARRLRAAHRFVCLTDDRAGLDEGIEPVALNPALRGWWAKIELFRPGVFEGRVLYLDLDVCVVGNLDEVVEHGGITDLRDWGWASSEYSSSLMVWDAGEHEAIWTEWHPSVPRRLDGDQKWITETTALGWRLLPHAWHRSYRYHCKEGIPVDCRVVSFHGPDKPHSAPAAWVKEVWRRG